MKIYPINWRYGIMKYMPLPETKSCIIIEHRKMWLYISRIIADTKGKIYVSDLKRFYISNKFGANIINDCFLCYYDLYICGLGDCSACPLCSGDVVCLNGLYQRCLFEKDWKKQAKLAYKIAMLPEVR